DTSARRVQEALDPIDARRLNCVHVDHRVVANNLTHVCVNKANPSHVGGKVVDFINTARGNQAILETAQIQNFEFLRGRGPILGFLDIDASNPVPPLHKPADQMVSNETSGASHQ